jgi:hypothetical protein
MDIVKLAEKSESYRISELHETGTKSAPQYRFFWLLEEDLHSQAEQVIVSDR